MTHDQNLIAKHPFMTKRLHHILNLAFFVLGLVFLFFLVRKFGMSELFEAVQRVRWNLIIVLALPTFWYVFHTLGWEVILKVSQERLSFFYLFLVKVSAEATNTLTPASWMAGDPLRIYLLKRKYPNLEVTSGIASVVLDRTLLTLAILISLILGLLGAWFSLDLPDQWKFLFPGLTLAIGLLLCFFIHRQKKGLFSSLIYFVDKIGFKKLIRESLRNKVEELDSKISQFHHQQPRAFFESVCFHFVARMLGVLEIYLIGQFLDIPLTFSHSLSLASLSVLVNIMFVFIPGSMGVMEGAYGAFFVVFGLNPLYGVALQLVRRLRIVFWSSLGVVFMLMYRHSKPHESLS